MDKPPSSTDSVLGHLFDGDLEANQRDSLNQRLRDDADLRSKAVGHSMVHGMLCCITESKGDEGRARMARVLLAIRSSHKPRLRVAKLAAAALVVLALGAASLVMLLNASGDDDQNNLVPQDPVQASASVHHTLQGRVSARAMSPGQWELTADEPSTLSFPNGALAVMGKGAVVQVADEGNRFAAITGFVSIEGAGLRVPLNDRPALLFGGPMVYSVADSGGVVIDLMQGVVETVDGQPVMNAGERLELLTNSIAGLADNRLDPDIAEGRALSVIEALQGSLEDSVVLNRERWLGFLKPILAEPVSRKAVVEIGESIILGLEDASPNEAEEFLEVLGMVVELQLELLDRKGVNVEEFVQRSVDSLRQFDDEMGAGGEEKRARFRESVRTMVQRWRKATPEQRDQQRVLLRMMLNNMLNSPDGD